ncbi:MFS siderochrome iron transporter 1 [Metarhizium brunneum]|uniref:MFS siderochrome iron transporter 1 n=1 Tax=Metarhizium brunneum TaxID=500148 RepID=A0A7D5Z3M2_9HYPO
MDKIKSTDGPRPPAGESDAEKGHHGVNTTAVDGSTTSGVKNDGNASDSDEFQDGVREVRAVTTVWSKTSLFSMFALLYLVSFVDYLQNNIDSILNPYITSSFGKHGLLNVGSVMSTIIGSVAPLFIAKVVDIWGRAEGFLLMVVVCVIGMIIKAVAQNVETYVAAHTMYWVGHIGIGYVMNVMLADMSSLRNRMLAIAINGTPRLVGNYAGPNIAGLFYRNLNFRWAFGAFSIILVACSAPAIGLMWSMLGKARREGVIEKRQASGRTWLQSIQFHVVEMDLVGMVLIMGALACILLPFNLVAYAPQQWETPYIIAMLVLGVLLFPAFYVWEAKIARVQFLPFRFLKQGTIIGGCLLYGVMFLSTFCWNGYFYSYLRVVHRQSLENAGYIVNTFSTTSVVFGPLVALFISYTGNFKWTAYGGVPVMLLGSALVIPFRQPNAPVGMLVFTQFLVGLGSEILVLCSSLACQAPVTHQQIAAVIALSGMFGGFGASIGLSIAGAIWNNLLPQKLYEYLPEGAKNQSMTIFGDIEQQIAFPDGSPEREAIVAALGDTMRLMVIAGVALMPLCAVCIYAWKNINVKKLEEQQGKQTKGTTL